MTEAYLVHGTSESGDDYVLGLYYEEPTEEQLSAIVRSEAPLEVEDGVSWLRPQVTKTRFKVMPEADPNPVAYL